MLMAFLVVVELGRELTRQFYSGEIAQVWSRMTPRMKAALGSAENLAGFRKQVETQAGLEQAVLDEKVETLQGLQVYRRIARFSKAPGEVEVRWTLDGEGHVAGFFVRPASLEEAPVKHSQAKTKLVLPFASAWTVVWGGRTLAQNYHASTRDQRFAFDFLIARGGTSHHGDGRKPGDFFAFGESILAPAGGTVIEAVDGRPDQAPGERDPLHAMGNYVVIDHGNGEYSFLCHLKRGSVKPKVGDKVQAGDALGLCGNSGNTSEPHLHYHLQDSPRPFDGDGLPAEFSDYFADGKRIGRGMPLRGEVIAPVPYVGAESR